jgi:hypothetical protein
LLATGPIVAVLGENAPAPQLFGPDLEATTTSAPRFSLYPQLRPLQAAKEALEKTAVPPAGITNSPGPTALAGVAAKPPASAPIDIAATPAASFLFRYIMAPFLL